MTLGGDSSPENYKISILVVVTDMVIYYTILYDIILYYTILRSAPPARSPDRGSGSDSFAENCKISIPGVFNYNAL